MKVVVTGGAGFIGSHLADAILAEGREVLIIDDLSSGRVENVNPKAQFLKKDIREELSSALKETDTVFHLAADPDVRSSLNDPEKSFDINVRGTFNLLESCRKADVKRFVFASSSAVYGNAGILPTPESAPLMPISNYGAGKAAGEAFLSSHSATYGMKGTVLRLANIFGERSLHGVIWDFFWKLRQDPSRLEILGNGKQEKSFLPCSDCVSAILASWEGQRSACDVFNIASRETKSVDHIASSMCRILGANPEMTRTRDPAGWAGDVPRMSLDIRKIEKLGWKQRTGFEEGMENYISLLKELPRHQASL